MLKTLQAGKGGKSREVCGCGHVFKDKEEGNMAEMYTELRWVTLNLGAQTDFNQVGKLYTVMFIYWQFPAFYTTRD